MEQGVIFHNRYKLKTRLGRGQFSEVWLAEDNSTKVDVALKIYAPTTGMDEDGAQMLSREFALVVNTIHENLLRPNHYDICDMKPYLVLPYCEQGSCAKKTGKMTEDEAWKFIHDVASGLAFLHSLTPEPIIHQDIKPDNIMIGPTGCYMITDFGVSTHSRSALRRSVGSSNIDFDSAGTIAYMGPERFQDKTPIKASDIYSLGATAFDLLAGEPPFGEHGGLFHNQDGVMVPNLPDKYSKELNFTIKSCLHFHPWDRPTASTLVRWAESRHPDMPVVAAPTSPLPNWIAVTGAAALAFGIIFTVGILIKNGSSSSAPDTYQQYSQLVELCNTQLTKGDLKNAHKTLDVLKLIDGQPIENTRFNQATALSQRVVQAEKEAEELDKQAAKQKSTAKKPNRKHDESSNVMTTKTSSKKAKSIHSHE